MSYEFIVPNTSSNVIFDGSQAVLATSSLSTAGNFNKYLKNNGSGNLTLTTIPATDVVTDASNRLVTDTQKTAWDAVNTSFTTNKNTASNICVLDGTGKVASGNLPATSSLPLAGGTMTGNIAMGTYDVTNIGNIIGTDSKTKPVSTIPVVYNSGAGPSSQATTFWGISFNVASGLGACINCTLRIDYAGNGNDYIYQPPIFYTYNNSTGHIDSYWNTQAWAGSPTLVYVTFLK